MGLQSPSSILLARVLEIYEPRFVAGYLAVAVPADWTAERVRRGAAGDPAAQLSGSEYRHLRSLLPAAPVREGQADFDFIDLFAGIGGMRRGFEQAGGRCVLTSEGNPFAVRTYKANHYADAAVHTFNEDIRDITLAMRDDVTEAEARRQIDTCVPDHDVLLASLPALPFHGASEDPTAGEDAGQGWRRSLFFDVARILDAKQPAAFVIETPRIMAVHDGGRTLRIMLAALEELGYDVADAGATEGADPKIINAVHFVPQHRERLVLAGFRRDLGMHDGFTLAGIRDFFPVTKPELGDILDAYVDPRYILPASQWEYFLARSARFRASGGDPGYSLVGPHDVTRPLTARYHVDGADILVSRGYDPALEQGDPHNRPRRLTPRECARLMGFDGPGESDFRIPVSDTQAYRLFGSASVVPVCAAIAQLMRARIVSCRSR